MTVGATTPAMGTEALKVALNDPEVLLRLVNHARSLLTSRAVRLSPNHRNAEAEEIAQNARSEAWRCLAEFDPNRDFGGWLYGIVRNVTRDHVKKYARGKTGPPLPIELDSLPADLGRMVGDTVADEEFVNDLLRRLPPDEREIIRLKYYEGLTFAEIGVRLGLNENTARMKHHRIIVRLRELGGAGEVQS